MTNEPQKISIKRCCDFFCECMQPCVLLLLPLCSSNLILFVYKVITIFFANSFDQHIRILVHFLNGTCLISWKKKYQKFICEFVFIELIRDALIYYAYSSYANNLRKKVNKMMMMKYQSSRVCPFFHPKNFIHHLLYISA